MLYGLDLFSGIGGLSIALAPWVQPVAYCESDRYCQAVLLSRMQDGSLPNACVWDDVRTLNTEELSDFTRVIDIIYGGFPCQDLSVAGLGRGLDGNRSGLVSHIFRLTDEVRPAYVFLENVPGIKSRGAEQIGKEMASRGYDCRWCIISAAEVGAPHLRRRWFFLAADSKRIKVWYQQQRQSTRSPNSVQAKRESVSLDDCKKAWRNTKPQIHRMDDGLPQSMDRIKALGNAVVPLQARTAFERLMGL